MPSPFPGMNPYLEQETVWHDFHERAIPLMAEMITAQVRPRYFVKIDQHVYIHEPDEEQRKFIGRGDVLVLPGTKATEAASGVLLMEAPAEVRQPVVDVERVSFLEIRDRKDRQLVTVLELLSPSNKRPGRDRDQYLAKCLQLLETTAHFVELDLLRGGPRLPWQDLPACDYYALVSRVEKRPSAGVWPFQLRNPLQPIPIPLRPGDSDAILDLQAMVHRIYDAAGYEDYIYDDLPDPPLGEADEVWAQTCQE